MRLLLEVENPPGSFDEHGSHAFRARTASSGEGVLIPSPMKADLLEKPPIFGKRAFFPFGVQ